MMPLNMRTGDQSADEATAAPEANKREALALLGDGTIEEAHALLKEIAQKQGPEAALRCIIDLAGIVIPTLKPGVISRRVREHAKARQPTKAP